MVNAPSLLPSDRIRSCGFFFALVFITYMEIPFSDVYAAERLLSGILMPFIAILGLNAALCGVYVHQDTLTFSGLRKLITNLTFLYWAFATATLLAPRLPFIWIATDFDGIKFVLLISFLYYCISRAARITERTGRLFVAIGSMATIAFFASTFTAPVYSTIAHLFGTQSLNKPVLGVMLATPIYGLSRIIFNTSRISARAHVFRIFRIKLIAIPAAIVAASIVDSQLFYFSGYVAGIVFSVAVAAPIVIDAMRHQGFSNKPAADSAERVFGRQAKKS